MRLEICQSRCVQYRGFKWSQPDVANFTKNYLHAGKKCVNIDRVDVMQMTFMPKRSLYFLVLILLSVSVIPIWSNYFIQVLLSAQEYLFTLV